MFVCNCRFQGSCNKWRKKQGEGLQQLEEAKDEIVKLTSDDGTEAREEITKQPEEAKGEI